MISEQFVYVAALFSLLGGVTYLIDTIKGKIKPNKITWFLWSLTPFIAFSAEIHQGVGLQSLSTFVVGFYPLLIFIASFINKNAVWKISFFDICCGAISLSILLLWYFLKSGNIVIIASIASEIFAAMPTIVKAYIAPKTENCTSYILGGMAGLITLLTINDWCLAEISFPLYLMILNFSIFFIIRYKLNLLYSSSVTSSEIPEKRHRR